MTEQYRAFPICNGLAPDQGPLGLPMDLNFASVNVISRDLVKEETSNIISFVQSIYVDNSANNQPVTFEFPVTRQRLVVPATAQGIWPVLAINPIQFSATSVGTAVVRIVLLNVPMPLTQYGPITVTGNFNADMTPIIAPFTDRSGTITLGGTSQVLMAANAARKRMIIQNPGTNIESIFINFTDPASATSASIELPPGATFDSETGPVSGEAVNIVAATTATRFVAKES